MNNTEFRSLIVLLNECGNSAKSRHAAVSTFMAKTDLTTEQRRTMVRQVLEPLESAKKEHSERGSSFGVKKAKVKARKTYAHPAFTQDLLTCQCTSCGKTLSGNGFRHHDHDDKWYYYHALPSCFPEQHKPSMQADRKYVAWMLPKLDNVVELKVAK